MALSDSEWLAWLESDDTQPVVLIEAGYYDGSAKTLYASDAGYIDPYDVDAPLYPAIIDSDIVVDDQIDAVLLSTIDILDDEDTIADYQFVGFSFKIFYGDRAWPRLDFRQEGFGKTKNFLRPKTGTYRFSFEDTGREYFDQLIKGNGKGSDVGMPFVFGRAFNVRPVRKTSTMYIFFTPAVVIYTDTTVRDSGVDLVLGESDDWTLNLSVDGSGDGLEMGIVLNSVPAGDITCDPVPFTASSSHLTSILAQVNAYVKRPFPVAASVSAFDLIPLGYVCYSYISFQEMLTEMAASLGANPRINLDGEMEFIRIDAPASPTRTVTVSNMTMGDLALYEREPPYLSLELGYKRNWTVQSTELAGSLSAANYALYGKEYSYLGDSRLLPSYPFSMPQKTETLIFVEADAQAELDRRFALRAVERSRWSFTGDATCIFDRIGTTISVVDQESGIEDDFVVIGNRKNLTQRVCELAVWK